MHTFINVNTFILRNVGNNAQIDADIVDDLMRIDNAEIIEEHNWSRRTGDGIIRTVATYTTGTVSASADSTTVTGASTVWTSLMAGRQIRFGTNLEYYRIARVNSTTELTLEQAVPAAIAASTAYTIFQNKYPVLSEEAATYSTGTVTVTNNSATVTGSSTVWDSTHLGIVFKVSGQTRYYRIKTVVSGTEITLERVYEGITAATQGYGLFTRASDIQRINYIIRDTKLTHPDAGVSLINETDPERTHLADPANIWVYAERAPCDQLQVELWPVPNAAKTYRVNFARAYDVTFTADDYSTPLYPSKLLVLKGSASAANFLLGKTGDKTWIDQRAYFIGLYEKALEAAVAADKKSSRRSVQPSGGEGSMGADYAQNHAVFVYGR